MMPSPSRDEVGVALVSFAGGQRHAVSIIKYTPAKIGKANHICDNPPFYARIFDKEDT
jgi:hypothetical protein